LIRKQIFEYQPPFNTYDPREVIVVADATFFGRRRDKFGVLVFKDIISNEILIWKYIESETIKDYNHLKHELLHSSFNIKGVVIDGKRSLFRAFDDFPVQMWHFHQKMIVQRYITRHPKLEASQDLKKIVSRLTSTTQTYFTNSLNKWYSIHEKFINEKSLNGTTCKEYFTHRKLTKLHQGITKSLKSKLIDDYLLH